MRADEAPTGILTFLIADIRGYTEFTQEHGDEPAARLAGKFAEITREGIEAHGGELTELRGDEALCVFSSPRAALRAAADLQTVYADETAIEPDLPLRVGIGLDAGEAVPVQGGYRGGALNLAARLCSRAIAGEVLVSQGVAHLARTVEGIQLEPQGEVELKGLSEPIRVFRVLTDRAVIAAMGESTDLLPALHAVTPIIGREAEVRRLRWSWRLARRGHGDVVAVLGPSGIGKTRLAAELAATVANGGGPTTYASFAIANQDMESALTDGHSPGLIVLDDLDCAGNEELRSLVPALAALKTTPTLVALLLDDDHASPELLQITHRLAGAPEAIVRLHPLDLDQMRQLAGLYAGAAAGSVPVDVLTATGGIPRKVHEEVSRWVYSQATRRLGALANQAASGRSDLRTVEADLADTVVDMQMVREQTRLFGLVAGREQADSAQPPYRGLTTFEAADAELFFGRERLVAELVSRLAGAPLLGVVGPSGSGKSSAVRAGLVPALVAGVLPGSEMWTIALLRPGEHPLRALDRALWTALPRAVLERIPGAVVPLAAINDVLEPDERLVVVVDQFEEAYTVCADEPERASFIAALVDAVSDPLRKVAVVLAVRADYYGRCAADARLAELLAANHVLVGPMSADEYRRAIVQPALRVGVQVEPELVDDLVDEVLGEPGALPLLSTTLLELWNRRDGRTIRRQAYLATGGVRGAVARLADEVYDGFDTTQQGIVRSILLRLAGPGEGDAAVRRRVPLAEFDAERNPEVAKVLDVLADRRLVTVSDGAAEVAHEALLREWPRVQGWLEEDREGRRLHSHLAIAAQEWAHRGRDAGELYRGTRLAAALDWTTQHNLDANELEREFVTTSRAASQRDVVRQQKQNRRLRGLLVGVAALLILALAAGSIALVQRQSAETQRQSAQDAARTALARQLGAEALTTPRIDQAMLLARQAVLLDASPQTESTLLATLLRSPAVLSTFTVPIQVRPLQIELSTDGGTLAVADNGGLIRFFDTRTRRESRPPLAEHNVGLPNAYGGPYFFAVHGLMSGSLALDVYDAQSMNHVRTLAFNPVFLNSPLTGRFDPLFASADGSTVYFAWTLANPDRSDGPAYLDSWDVNTGQHRVVALGSNGMDGAAWLPARQQLMVVTDTAAITLDGRTLLPVRSVPLNIGIAYVAVSPYGDTLAVQSGQSGQPGDTFSVIDLTSGSHMPAAGSHAGPIDSIAFTPEGRSIVTTGDDGDVIVWDTTSAAPIETISGHSGRVLGQAISADGSTLYTSGLDGAIFVCDFIGSRRFGRPFNVFPSAPPPRGLLKPALAVAPDSSRFATRIGPGRVGIFDVASLRIENAMNTSSGDVSALAWSSNQQLAVGTEQMTELWDVRATPQLVMSLDGVAGSARAMAFSADGNTVAAVTDVPSPPNSQNPADGGWLGVWDTRSGHLRVSRDLGIDGLSVAFDRQARQIAAGTGDGRVLVFDAGMLRTEQMLSPVGRMQIYAVAFRADGVLLTGAGSGIVQHWNPQTGAELAHPVLVEAAPVSSLAIDPTGNAFATSGGSSGGLKIWDDVSLQQFGATFPGGAGKWGNAAYTPDGSNVVVIYGDGSGAVWPVSLKGWEDHACAVAQRNFTQEEWSRFVPGEPYARTCPALPGG